MKPLEDWMVVKLYEKQAAKMDIKIALPETVDMSNDESAVFEILRLGPGTEQYPTTNVEVGDIVMLYGVGSVNKIELPNRKKVYVAQARNVCFVMEKEDLE